MSFRWYFAQ